MILLTAVVVSSVALVVGVRAAAWRFASSHADVGHVAWRMGPSVRPVTSTRELHFVEVLPHVPHVEVRLADGWLVAAVDVAETNLGALEVTAEGWQARPLPVDVALRRDEDFLAAVATLQRAAQTARLDGDRLLVATRGGHAALPENLAPLLPPLFQGTRSFAAALGAATTRLAQLRHEAQRSSSSSSSGSPFVVRG